MKKTKEYHHYTSISKAKILKADKTKYWREYGTAVSIYITGT